MATRVQRPFSLSLIGCGLALLMACNADKPQDEAPSDTPSPIATVARPSAPAPTATPIALSATATPATGTTAAVPTPEPQGATSPVNTVTPSQATPMPDSSPISPTTEPTQSTGGSEPAPTPTPAPAVTNTPAPTAIATPLPASTPTPAPPGGPGSPDANVGRATQFVPLDQPRFVPASSAQSMTGESLVLGLRLARRGKGLPVDHDVVPSHSERQHRRLAGAGHLLNSLQLGGRVRPRDQRRVAHV